MHVRYSYLSQLQCSLCHQPYNADQLHTTSQWCTRPLLAQYDLTVLAHDLTKEGMFISLEAAKVAAYQNLLTNHFENQVMKPSFSLQGLMGVPGDPCGRPVWETFPNLTKTVKCTTALAV